MNGAIQPLTACEAAGQAAYEHFRAHAGDDYRTRWEHLSEEAQSLWCALATCVHNTWEAHGD